MATDIAFSLGCLSLVRQRVPASVFVFLTALAIFDDLGAILVIALFYGGKVHYGYLALAALISWVLVMLGKSRVQAIWPYGVLGVALWLAVLRSGIEATIAGVIVGLSLPTEPSKAPSEVIDDLEQTSTALRRHIQERGIVPDGIIATIERHLESVQSPLHRTLHGLHGPVAFGIVPLFAMVNAGVAIDAGAGLVSSVSLGVSLGLFIGKPVGVLTASWLAIRLGAAVRPSGATLVQLLGAGIMAGIGFTMSLFVGNIGLGPVPALEAQAKIGILAGSFASAVVGLVLLRFKSQVIPREEQVDVSVVVDVPRFAPGYGVRACAVAGPLVGQSLTDLDVRRRFGVLVIGVWRSAGAPVGSRHLEPVDPQETLREGTLLVAGADDAVEAFVQFVREDAAADDAASARGNEVVSES
jgi:NhaA family Na+:H+ antiporter